MSSFYHDTARDLLVYRPATPMHADGILRHIPNARQINPPNGGSSGSVVAMRRTLRNAQVMRWLNYPVVPVIDDANYDWPIEPGRKPLAHQKLYANFQVLNPRCFNLGDPGTMKTLSSLWAADWLMRQHPAGKFRCLIVCPLTIIDTGWATAIFKNFLNRRSIEILHGTPEKRSSLLARKPDFALINYDGVGIGAHTQKRFALDGFAQQLASDEDIQLVIVDEARAYGDATSKRSRLARIIFGDKPYMWELCGSPTPQAPTDCYGMAKLLNNAHGKSFGSFRDETMMRLPHSQFQYVPRREGYERARKLLTPAIRFTLDEIWDGPEQTIQPASLVPLSEEQKKLLTDLKRDLTLVLKSGHVITPLNEAAARLKLLQICAGALYDADHRGHLIDSSPRMTEIKKIIDSTERKVVMFVNFTVVINMIHRHLSEIWGKQRSKTFCAVLNGDTPRKERAELLTRFRSDPNFKLMIADPTATAHGVNEFVEADTAIWDGPPDKADLWNQGNSRLRRPGQQYPSTIFPIMSTKTEQEIFSRLQSRTSLQGLMLESIRRGEL